jgi:hypothetical protein
MFGALLPRCTPVVAKSSALALLTLLLATPVAAQWVGYPTANVPRNADGSVNMKAPAPRLPNGKPDLSGIWVPSTPGRQVNGEDLASDGDDITTSPQMANLGVGLEGGLPYQDWLKPIVKQRTDSLAIDDPHIRCLPDNFLRAYGLPHMLKYVHTLATCG